MKKGKLAPSPMHILFILLTLASGKNKKGLNRSSQPLIRGQNSPTTLKEALNSN